MPMGTTSLAGFVYRSVTSMARTESEYPLHSIGNFSGESRHVTA